MPEFIFGMSLTYILCICWYHLVDRKNKKKFFLIPSEFLFVILAFAWIGWFFFNVWPDMKFLPEFYDSKEKMLFAIGIIMSLTMICLHAIAKYLDDRRNIDNWPKWLRLLIHHVHLRISHNCVYFAAALSLATFSLIEIKEMLVYSSKPSPINVLLSALIFSYAFYKTIVYGNTWRLARFVLLFFAFFIGQAFYQSHTQLSQAPIAAFSFSVLLLTPLAVMWRKVWSKKLRIARLSPLRILKAYVT